MNGEGEHYRTDLVERTRLLSLRILTLCKCLHGTYEQETIGSQLFRCATSVAVHYRIAQHSISPKDFLYKLKICDEESDEVCCWLDMLVSADILPASRLSLLIQEAHEISAIISTICKKLRKKRRFPRP